MKIKNHEIMKQLKINLDRLMLITPISKNMVLGITEGVEDNLLGKLHVELLQGLSQK